MHTIQSEPSLDTFSRRHIGPDATETAAMLKTLDLDSMEALVERTVPPQIRLERPLDLPAPAGERAALNELRAIAAKNQIFKSYIGQGYSDCITPPVIQRNILENPGWYTAYTPYQAEISQGRLEALLNFQTMITDLTGMAIANASLLDEGTAAAEAMTLCYSVRKQSAANVIVVSTGCHPQTIAVVETRARQLGIKVVTAREIEAALTPKVFAVLLQYPETDGVISDIAGVIEKAHKAGALAVVAADLLALTVLKAPAELGADVAVGNSQRFGVPLGFGGPHAAFMATRDELKRSMPGRLVGVSKDVHGRPAYRLSLQTREQHIRREKATSNICTAQVLLAVIASMYAIYHGPEGLQAIALRIHRQTRRLAAALKQAGFEVSQGAYFDTIRVGLGDRSADEFIKKAEDSGINLRVLDARTLSIALDETTDDLSPLLELFEAREIETKLPANAAEAFGAYARTSPILSHPVFHKHHTETEMLRYLRHLEAKDLSLTTSMIPLGSCTMKLNATSEMLPITWPEFAAIHPMAPAEQTLGYQEMIEQLEDWLAEITGFAGVSLQPNAGSQGEYSGLLAIRAYHESRGEAHRNICLIPTSAHGTNPASAAMAGLKVVPVKCEERGDIDLADLREKASTHAANLACLMVTYPSTHGVFEPGIVEICDIVHANGGQVYMDGANMNAQVGLTSPGAIGADVCHLNLHKTFCIPHGGGGPGVGPVCVAAHLVPFLPNREPIAAGARRTQPQVSSAPFGSASILPISWMYIRMMGAEGLTESTRAAILNANYIARRLESYYPVLFKGSNGLVAHECIIDLRQFHTVTAEDVAKRLMDYGFHAPTLSWPVGGTLMIEPTESESKEELDRFCDAMIGIHGEIVAIESGEADLKNNVLKNAPHTAEAVTSDSWERPYGRQQAAYPAAWLRERKFWPSVGRVDNVYGDRNLFCSCPPVEESAG